MVAEAVADPEVKDQFLEQMISESGYLSGLIHDALKEYLLSFDNQEMINKIMALDPCRMDNQHLRLIPEDFDMLNQLHSGAS